MTIQEVEYEFDWTTFKKGWSFFVPCTDVEGAEKVLKEEAKKHKCKIVVQSVIENQLRGLRCWKTK